MRPCADGLPGVVQKQSQIQDKGVFDSFKDFAIGGELRIIDLGQRIEFVDADQRMFVGGITMEKLMLH